MLEFRRNVCRSTDGLERPDVVLGSSVHLHAADAGRRLARRYRVPFVLEIRDVWPETLADVGGMSRLHPVYRYLRRMEKRLYRAADRVITLLPGMERYLDDHGVPPVFVRHIPNGVDPAMFPEPAPAAGEPFTLTFFGAHGRANGLDTLVRAAELLKDDGVRFLLVGDGPEKPALQETAGENVEFRDPVPKEDLRSVVAESHAFVFHLREMEVLRRYGVSANKLFEYLLSGRPTVFACVSLNNPVEEAGAGPCIPPRNPEALAEAARKLKGMPQEERDAMGRNGRAWVLEHRDIGKLAAKLETCLAELKENGGRVAARPARSVRKRAFDVAVSGTMLLALSPILLLVSLFVLLSSGLPVLFRQRRPGLRGTPFRFLKFRTMRAARSEEEHSPAHDAGRLTAFGKLLRKTSLDELPQLWNVLRGDMSLVGPRPLLMQYLDRYSPRQARRHEAKPGITGWAQVNGRNAITWEQKFEYDVWYVDHWTFWIDVKILLITVWKTLKREGISQEGRATMEEFMGSSES
jgi:lipopolysaccharide/colanic/teichoic acid biosynthesis glycosyltransferase